MKKKMLYASAVSLVFLFAPAICTFADEEAEEPAAQTISKESTEESPEETPAAILQESEAEAEVPSAVLDEGETDEVSITSITANTVVGDGQREVYNFVITVDNADAIASLTAADFNIINNVPTTVFDEETKTWYEEYEDDGITLTIDGDTIILNCTPFDYAGKYQSTGTFIKDPWEVLSTISSLSFTAADVTTVNTLYLDDAIIGEYTYAGITRTYALYLPKDEDGNIIENVPIVIWNHGGGEYAGDIENTLVANKGFTGWLEQGYITAVLEIQVSNPNYSYFTATDAPDGWNGTTEEKIERQKLIDANNALQAQIVKDLIAEGIVDPDRVYVTGASSGGGATMRFILQNTDLVAGAIACCSMDPIVWVHFNEDATLDELIANFEEDFQSIIYVWDEEAQEMAAKDIDTEALINIPIYFTHAENDPTCSVRSSQAMYQALLNLGAENNMIAIWDDETMAEAGISNANGGALLHWSWVKVLNESDEGSPMYWLFMQSKASEDEPETPEVPEIPARPEKPAKPHKHAPAASTTAASTSASVDTSAGTYSIQWTFAGLSAAAGAVLLEKKKHED